MFSLRSTVGIAFILYMLEGRLSERRLWLKLENLCSNFIAKYYVY